MDTELRIETTGTSKVTYVTCDYDVELIVDTHPGEGFTVKTKVIPYNIK